MNVELKNKKMLAVRNTGIVLLTAIKSVSFSPAFAILFTGIYNEQPVTINGS